jgi:hypothetical protein
MAARHGLARPAKTETNIKNTIHTALRLHAGEHRTFTPAKRQEYTYDLGQGYSVILRGGNAFDGPSAEYRGPEGQWFAYINPKGIGKPWMTLDGPTLARLLSERAA